MLFMRLFRTRVFSVMLAMSFSRVIRIPFASCFLCFNNSKFWRSLWINRMERAVMLNIKTTCLCLRRKKNLVVFIPKRPRSQILQSDWFLVLSQFFSITVYDHCNASAICVWKRPTSSTKVTRDRERRKNKLVIYRFRVGSDLKMLPSACSLKQYFQDLAHSFSLYRPPSWQITNVQYGKNIDERLISFT